MCKKSSSGVGSLKYWIIPILRLYGTRTPSHGVRALSCLITGLEQSGTAYSAETVIGFLQRDIVYACCMLVVHNSTASLSLHTYTTQNARAHGHNGHIENGAGLIKCPCDPNIIRTSHHIHCLCHTKASQMTCYDGLLIVEVVSFSVFVQSQPWIWESGLQVCYYALASYNVLKVYQALTPSVFP